MEKLKYLHNSEIDLKKWDQTMHQAPNSRVYAESWYLDIVAPDWYGLIFGDYEYIMPVISAKKWGIRYAYQPQYSQQHGIFPAPEKEISALFWIFLQNQFKYFQIAINSKNIYIPENLRVEKRNNHTLSLNDAYKTIQRHYSNHAKRYVQKAHREVDILERISAHDFLNLKVKHAQKGFSNTHAKALKLIVTKSMNHGSGIVYGAYSKRNELLAAAFFIRERHRLNYLNSVSSEEGKEHRAMYAILDKFIQDYQGSGFILDFEGSDIEGVARFFKGFGATTETYKLVTQNKLPRILKVLKS